MLPKRRTPQPSGFHNWVFTLNNYTPADEALLQSMPFSYLLYGRELAPSTGTPHLQGYIQLKKKLRRSALLKYINMHWEPARGSVQDQDYCKKSGDYVELGTAHSPLGAACPLAVRIALNSRLRTAPIELLVDDGTIHYTHLTHVLSARRAEHDDMQSRVSVSDLPYSPAEQPNLWISGPTGTGKSRMARSMYPGAYPKELTKWWCGYSKLNPAHRAAVLVEEWEPKDSDYLKSLKIWADVYPFPVQVKGGHLGEIRPQHIVVTSNYSIEAIWPAVSDHAPLLRRFKQVYLLGPPTATSYCTGGASQHPQSQEDL